jgi:hypothetical protein
MKLSELIPFLRPARFDEKAGAFVWGATNGNDVKLPYLQAGWVTVGDGQYTQGAPRAIAGNARTQITIDGLGAGTNRDYANGMHSDVWSGNRFNSAAVGETYTVSMTLTLAQSSGGSGHFATFDADIGTDQSPNILAAQSVALNKGQGQATLMTIAAPFVCMDDFGLRGARLFITPSVNVTMWGVSIFIQRTFKP